MNTKSYIESGLLEANILGWATEAEQQELLQYRASHADIAVAFTETEALLTSYFEAKAVPPPPFIKTIVEEKQYNGSVKKWQFDDTPYATTTQAQPIAVEYDNTHIKVHKYWRPAFIAVFILSKIFLILALYFYFKADAQDKEIEKLRLEIQQK